MNMIQLPDNRALNLETVSTVGKLENLQAKPFYRVSLYTGEAFGTAGGSFIIHEDEFSRTEFLKLCSVKVIERKQPEALKPVIQPAEEVKPAAVEKKVK